MKNLVFTACLLCSKLASANALYCRQYIPKGDDSNANNKPQLIKPTATPTPAHQPMLAKIDIDNGLKVQLTTDDAIFKTLNTISLQSDSWLSASYFDAYSNLDNENLLYAVYFSKDWQNSKDKVIPVMINIDDMQAKSSYRIVLMCVRESDLQNPNSLHR